MNEQKKLCCPKCGCTELSSGKQGFGVGKFVVGTMLANPIVGVLAGGIGKNSPEVYCMRCGSKFKPGSTFNGLVTVSQYNSKKRLALKKRNSGESKEETMFGCGTGCAIMSFIFFIGAASNRLTGLAFIGIILLILAVVLFVLREKKKKQRLEKEEADAIKSYIESKKQKQLDRIKKIEELKKKFTIVCPECNTEMNGCMKFCPACGLKVEITGTFLCPDCDMEMVDPSVSFCPNCGRNLLSSANNMVELPNIQNVVSVSSEKEKIGWIMWIAAYCFPYIFVFSKHKKIRVFSGIVIISIIVLATVISVSQKNKVSKNNMPTTSQADPVKSAQATIQKKNLKKIKLPNVISDEIILFSQLPLNVKRDLKTIGISEHFGTELLRRDDLEDFAEMRCYRIKKCCILPKNVNDTVYLYMKNNTIDMVTYAGRTILGHGIKVHIKQAVVDSYYKYSKDRFYEIKELLQEGWRPSLVI